MTDLDRRSFIKRSAAVAAGSAVLGGPFAGFVAGGARAAHGPAHPALVPTADLADGVTRLALPPGFAYRSFHRSNKSTPVILDDGARLPGRHDGMGAFAGPGGDVILVRNHEENGPGRAFSDNDPVYDEMAQGGTSTVLVSHQGVVVESFASLAGTQMNCSGGIMPWGSWVTCEETVNGPDVADDFTRTPPGGTDPGSMTFIQNSQLLKPHGFIYEVPAQGKAAPKPIRNAGRFAHEAVAWSGDALYLTEDDFAFPSGLYKYVPTSHPERSGRIVDGGRLYMLKVVGASGAELARGQAERATFAVEWVKIDNPWFYRGDRVTPAMTNDDALRFVSRQGLAKGAAKFSRLEGAVADSGWVFFTSTQGGGGDPSLGAPDGSGGYGNGWGQVWGLDTRTDELHLIFQSPNRDTLDFPDNVTTSRSGTIILCEDHDAGNFLRGLTQSGALFDIAQNVSSTPNDEFAGSTFSPDGNTLFVNIQASTGRSFAIWGPWESIGV